MCAKLGAAVRCLACAHLYGQLVKTRVNSAHIMLCEKRVCAPEGSAAVQKDVLNPGSKTKLEVFSSLCFFSLSASSAAEQVSAGSQLKGEKRKASEEEEKNGREELVEKKVCKGFQTV